MQLFQQTTNLNAALIVLLVPCNDVLRGAVAVVQGFARQPALANES